MSHSTFLPYRRHQLRTSQVDRNPEDRKTHAGCPRCGGSKRITLGNKRGFGEIGHVDCPHYAPIVKLPTVEDARFHEEVYENPIRFT